MSTKPAPARVHILLARDAPVGLILRRGPSTQVAVMEWNLRNDTILMGQWLKSRIYPRRSDLSPDGKLFVYFVLDGKWSSDKGFGTYTAVSRAPYLKAISLYSEGSTYGGGGFWTSNSTFWFDDYAGFEVVRENDHVRRDKSFKPDHPTAETIYHLRLLRAGWEPISPLRQATFLDWLKGLPRFRKQKHGFDLYEKEVGHGWSLLKAVGSMDNRGDVEFHQIIRGEEIIDLPHWEWAEVDRKRLVYVDTGRLFAIPLTPAGLGEPRELHDFNDMTFEPLAAPY